MKMIRSFLFRYRLITSMLALAFLAGALAVPPANADIGMLCSTGCINWTQEDGCLDCQSCCSFSTGLYECTHDYNDRIC